MERGKGGISSWSTGAFRAQPQAGDAAAQGAQSPTAPSSGSPRTVDVRPLETGLPLTGGGSMGTGRFSGGAVSGGLIGSGMASSHDVVIAPGCTVQGKLELKGRALVNARVEGELTNDVELVVGEQGSIEGNLSGASIRVFGRVKGDITCTERLELRSGASVTGNLASPSLVIEDGVFFDGHCRMWDPRGAAQETPSNSRLEEDDEPYEEDDKLV